MSKPRQTPGQLLVQRNQSDGGKIAMELTADARSSLERFADFLSRNNDGNAIVETALVLPILMAMMMAIYTFGTAYSNQLTLTNAVQQGAIAVEESLTNNTSDPCLTASQAIVAAAPTLNSANITYTLWINNTNVYPSQSSGTSVYGPTKGSFSCSSAPSLVEGTGANITVIATYPCNFNLYGLSVASSCTLPPAVSTVPIQ